MVHGQRDWSNIGADQTVHGLADMAELAARLWSPVTFNREGNVLFLETFDDGYAGWAATSDGAGNEIRWSALLARYGPYSLRMVPGTDSTRLAKISRALAYPVLSKMGLEMAFNVTGYLEYINFIMYLYDGSQRHTYHLRYDDVNDVLQYRDENGAFQTIATGVTISKDSTLFHSLKLVCDMANGLYSRCILDDTEYNMDTYLPYTSANTTARVIEPWIEFTTQAGKATIAYVDDVVVTQNEP